MDTCKNSRKSLHVGKATSPQDLPNTPSSVTMGQLFSKAMAEGKYEIILDADGEILQSPGQPGIDYESPDNALHLKVLDWRKPSRAFSLELAAGAPESSEFRFEADYKSDVLNFWFKLHRDYQGGRQELLRRTQRLFREDNFLGISQIFIGSQEVAARLGLLKKSHNKRNNWQPAVVRYGCSLSWLKRSEPPGRAYFKLVVDKEETSLLSVDCSNDEYKVLVGAKPEKFFQIMTIPTRIWMCTVLTMRRFREMKQDPSLDEFVNRLDAISEGAESGDTAEQKDNKVHQFLRRCMEERTLERSPAAQEVGSFTDNEHKIAQSHGSTSGNGASMGSDAAVREANTSKPTASKATLKKKRRKERQRMLKAEQRMLNAEQLREEFEKLAALYEAHEGHEVTRHELVAVDDEDFWAMIERRMEHLVDTIVETTEELSFTTAPPSPLPLSPSPQPPDLQAPQFFQLLRSRSRLSCASEPLPSPTFHTPPSTVPSSYCPPRASRTPDEMISPLNRGRQMGSLGLPTNIRFETTPSHRVSAEPDNEAHDISIGEIIAPGCLASNINQSQSPAIEDKTTCPQTQIPTRSEREYSRPAPTLSLPLRGSAAVFNPCVSEQTGQHDTDLLVSGDSQATPKPSAQPASGKKCNGQQHANLLNISDSKATIKASTRPYGKKATKPRRKKPGKSNTRKRTADKGPSNDQEQHFDDDETRQNDVSAQDGAVTDAVSQRHGQPTHEPSSSNLETSFTEKQSKDKGKARVSEITTPEAAYSLLDTAQSSISADIQSCPEDALSAREATATPRAPPFSRQALTELELPEASADFWAPVKPATDPDMGESSKMAATRAKTSSSRTVIPAVPISRGASTETTTAKTPGSRTAVPAGPQQGDASSSRTTKATTPGPSTAVPAGSEEVEFAQGAYPATTPGIATAVPAGPSPGNALAPPASITDRSARTSRVHAHDPTSEPRAAESTENVDEKKRFFYDLTYHGFKCQLHGCDKRCTLWDSTCAICPACGPYSKGIYCCKEHMREDVKFHWTICGQLVFDSPCVVSSVPFRSLVGPPQIHSVHDWDTPEHHRQAMYFCTARQEGDYFIFSEYHEQVLSGVPLGEQMSWRCLPRVLFTVTFTDEEEKDRFRRVLAVCLMMSLEVQPLVWYLFQLIRDWFRARGEWSAWMDGMLKYQFRYEMGITLTAEDIGERHACPCEWTGRNLRHCRDPTCVSKRSWHLGDLEVGRGFRGLCHALEANHWLLRAHRATHPTVKGVEARTRGDGFADVLPEAQRLFRRGEGWDGFESGPMEMEESLSGVAYCRG